MSMGFCNRTLISGRASQALAEEVGQHLGISLGGVLIETFPDGEIGVQILEDVHGRDVYIVQTMAHDPNLYLMELLMMVDAYRRSGARSITAVIPYLGYMRQDRRGGKNTPIAAKLVANLLERAGVTRVITVDLHTEQVEGFFDIPLENLHARPVFLEALLQLEINQLAIVAPDIGSVRLARSLAKDMKADFALIDKSRLGPLEVRVNSLVGEVKDKDVILVDDMYSTGNTLKSAALACRKAGATRVYGCVTHMLARDLPSIPDELDLLIATNSIEQSQGISSKLHVVSIAKLLARAITLEESEIVLDSKSHLVENSPH